MDKKKKKYIELRTEMLEKFKHCDGSNEFYQVFNLMDNNIHLIIDSCDKSINFKDLDYSKKTPPLILFQILRLARRPVLLRELEQTTSVLFPSKKSIFEAFTVLYSIELIKYDIANYGASINYLNPKDCVYLSFKENENEL